MMNLEFIFVLFCFNKKPKPFSPSQIVACLPPSVNMTFISEWGWFLPPWNIYHFRTFSLPQLWDASSLWCVGITFYCFQQSITHNKGQQKAKMSVVLRVKEPWSGEKQSFLNISSWQQHMNFQCLLKFVFFRF